MPATRPKAPLLVYDGDCGFCTASARWIGDRLPDDVAVVPYQRIDIARWGLELADVTGAAWWIDRSGRRHRGHRAIARSLEATGRPWSLAGVALRVPPVSWAARAVYWLVARFRHRMPGGTDSCRLD